MTLTYYHTLTCPRELAINLPGRLGETRMKFQLGKLSVGDILDRGLKVLFSRLLTFFLINLVVLLPLVGLIFLFIKFITLSVTSVLIAFGVGTVLFAVLWFVGIAAQLKIIEQMHIGRRVGIGEAVLFALRRVGPLLLVSIVYGLAVLIGLFLLIIPGMIFFCMYAFASQAVVLEGLGPIAGMNRSEKLTKGFKWRIFGILLLIGVLTLLLDAGLVIGMSAIIPITENVSGANGLEKERLNETNLTIHLAIMALASILLNTYLTVCLILTYFDLRTRKEGFDLELTARGLAQNDHVDRVDDRDDRRYRSRSRSNDHHADDEEERSQWAERV